MFVIGVSVLLLIASFYNFGSDYYNGKWVGFSIAFLFMLNVEIQRRYGSAIALLIGYCFISAVWISFDTTNRYASVTPYDLMALKYFAAESALKLFIICIPFVVMRINLKSLELYGGALSCIFLLWSTCSIFVELLVRGCSLVNSCGGALGNPSLNAGMMAVCLPLAFKYFGNPYRWIALVAASIAIVLGKSNVGVGMVAVFLLMHLFASKNWRLLSLIPIVVFCGWYFLGAKFGSSGDRFLMWKFFMSKWATNPKHWALGSGFGTFGVFSINLQRAFGMREGMWWIWMHNDWLQALFETGAIGLSLMIWTYTAALKGLLNRKLLPEMQSLLLYGIMMLMNFPLHVALSCAFVGWLLCLALYKPDLCIHNKL